MMPVVLAFLIQRTALLIEFAGSLLIAGGCLKSAFALMSSRASQAGIVRARLLVADAIIAGLGFKTAATLLKTIELQSWSAILMFASVLTLRTVVKRFLSWEEQRLLGTK